MDAHPSDVNMCLLVNRCDVQLSGVRRSLYNVGQWTRDDWNSSKLWQKGRRKHNRTWLFENWHLREWTMPMRPTCIYLISYRTYSHVRHALDAMNMLWHSHSTLPAMRTMLKLFCMPSMPSYAWHKLSKKNLTIILKKMELAMSPVCANLIFIV